MLSSAQRKSFTDFIGGGFGNHMCMPCIGKGESVVSGLGKLMLPAGM